MNQMKRKFIHEYAPYFGLTSQSMDKRHSRSVDVTAEKNNVSHFSSKIAGGMSDFCQCEVQDGVFYYQLRDRSINT